MIDNLNFKLNSGFLIPGTNKKLDEFDDDSTNLNKRLVESVNSDLSGVNYKNTYDLEENDLQESILKQTHNATERRNSLPLIRQETKDTPSSTQIRPETESGKKILNKRPNSKVNNQSSENTEVIAIKLISSNSNSNLNTNNAANNSNPVSKSGRRSRKASLIGNKKATSPRINTSNLDDANNLENRIDLLVLGPKRTESDNYLDISSASARTPHRTSLASHLGMQSPANQVAIIDNSLFQLDNNVYVNESLSENLAPITISVTKIDHELTGNSIRVRRFFDRQTMRIKKMPLYDSKTNQKIGDSNEMHGKQIPESHYLHTDSKIYAQKTTLGPPFSTPDINFEISLKETEKTSVCKDGETENRNEADFSQDETENVRKTPTKSRKHKEKKKKSQSFDELNSKIEISNESESLDETNRQVDSENEIETHEYLADLNRIEKEKSNQYLNTERYILTHDPHFDVLFLYCKCYHLGLFYIKNTLK